MTIEVLCLASVSNLKALVVLSDCLIFGLESLERLLMLLMSVCPAQVPVLSVWQPDWHAVPHQRSVRSAPAAALPGHGGAPGGRPLVGKKTYKMTNFISP